MTRADRGALAASKEAIARTLACPKVSDATLRCRLAVVMNTVADLRRFAPWPALESSLLADAKAIREQIRTRNQGPAA